MLNMRHIPLRVLKANGMTLAIVGGVVLINSVVWAIPLIIGQPVAPTPDSRAAPASTPPDSVANDRAAGDKGRATSGRVRRAAAVLLPVPRPPGLPPLPLRRATQLAGAIATTPLERDQAPLSSRAPKTLFPHPEPAPEVLLTPSRAVAVRRVPTAVTNATTARRPMPDVVLVSPYAPGVRLDAKTGDVEWSHPTGSTRSSARSATASAPSIVRRAAEQLEQMRQHMARLDIRDTPHVRAERISRSAVLPVAPRPPRLIDISGRALTSRQSDEVRPRLVRRPLAVEVAETPLTATRQHWPEAPQSVRVARLAPPSAAVATDLSDVVDRVRPSASAQRRAALHRPGSRSVGAVSRRRAVEVSRRRAVRRQRQAGYLTAMRQNVPPRAVRRRPATIDGFRRGFYHQLVSANFFAGQN